MGCVESSDRQGEPLLPPELAAGPPPNSDESPESIVRAEERLVAAMLLPRAFPGLRKAACVLWWLPEDVLRTIRSWMHSFDPRTALQIERYYSSLRRNQTASLSAGLSLEGGSETWKLQLPLMHLAAVHGDIKAITTLCRLKGFPILNNGDQDGRTLMQLAAGQGNDSMVAFLAGCECCDISLADDAGATPAHAAAANGHASTLRRLAAFGLDVGKPQNDLQTPAHFAATFGSVACLATLHECGCALDAPDATGATPLHVACFAGHSLCVSFLIDLGCSPDAVEYSVGASCAYLAAHQGRLGVLRILAAAGCDLQLPESEHGSSPAFITGYEGHVECLAFLHTQGCDLWSCNTDGQTVFDGAREGGCERCFAFVKSLHEQKVVEDRQMLKQQEEERQYEHVN